MVWEEKCVQSVVLLFPREFMTGDLSAVNDSEPPHHYPKLLCDYKICQTL